MRSKQDNKPYLFASDFFGAPLVPDMDTNGFVVAGTCNEQLFGMCESMWRPGEDIFSSVWELLFYDRNRLQGWSRKSYLRLFHSVCSQVCTACGFDEGCTLLIPRVTGFDRDCVSGWGANVYVM